MPPSEIRTESATFFISRADDYVSRELRDAGGYHGERLDNALRLTRAHRGVSPHGVLLNLGAHVGTVLIPALQTACFREALAIEPAPENQSLLAHNLVANQLYDRVRIVPVAVGDSVRQAELYLSRTNSGNHTLLENKLVCNIMRPHVAVQVTTVDQLLTDFGVRPEEVGFVVMDVQGFERQAIVGGASVFSLSPPMMMEMDHHFIENQQELESLCRSLANHYEKFFDLDDTTLVPRPVSTLEDYFHTFPGYRDMLFL